MNQMQPEILEMSGQFDAATLFHAARQCAEVIKNPDLANQLLAGFHAGLLDTSFMATGEWNDEMTMS
jgi:hypothetical protein